MQWNVLADPNAHVRPMKQSWATALLLLLTTLSLPAGEGRWPWAGGCQVVTSATAKQTSLGDSSIDPLGTRTLLFLRVRYTDDAEDPVSFAEANKTLAATDQLFRSMSRGRFGLTWTISEVLPLNQPRDHYAAPGGFELLLNDARAAATKAGLDPANYELDVVRHSGVSTFTGGTALLGMKGAQVQAAGPVILVHELGHNLGLHHANAWETSAPVFSLGSPPLPSNYETLPDIRGIPFYPDSQIGHVSVTGAGYSIEYGDLWDVMGSGDSQFNAAYQQWLGWLDATEVARVINRATTLRLRGLEAAAQSEPAIRGIQVGSPVSTPVGERVYWAQLPPRRTGESPREGVTLFWVNPNDPPTGTLLLTARPDSSHPTDRFFIPLGRTYSDLAAGIHVTPLAFGTDAHGDWADVAVHQGAFPSNRPPSLSILETGTTLLPGQSVTLQTLTLDPDGDSLAWHWDLGDGTTGPNAPSAKVSWKEVGDHVVRVEVSDLHGGRNSAHITLRVGAPATFRVSGRVLDPSGRPVPGVLVHNGVVAGREEERPAVATLTDADGRYALVGLVAGTYTNGANAHGFTLTRRAPIVVTANQEDIDFVAAPLPRVRVERLRTEVAESAGIVELFEFVRTGPMDRPLDVRFRFGGTASGGEDYVRPLLNTVTIAAGSERARMALTLQNDSRHENDETLSLTVDDPAAQTRTDAKGAAYTVFYPGWELIDVLGSPQWIQTEPNYLPDLNPTAELVIHDDDLAVRPTLAIVSDDLPAVELPRRDSGFTLTRDGGDPAQELTVFLTIIGTAVNGTDYTLLDPAVTFTPGEIARRIVIRPFADGLVEGAESVQIRLAPSPSYVLSRSSASIEILDGDGVVPRLEVERFEATRMRIKFRGTPNATQVLERSVDLVHWEGLQSIRLDRNGEAQLEFTIDPTVRALFRSSE